MTRTTRWVCGAALVTTFALLGAIVTAPRAGAHTALPSELAFSNSAGVLATLTTSGSFEPPNPFFADLGTNGRSCVTCHRPAQAWSITPVEVTERFERTKGLDPIFRANDGSNCEGADLSGASSIDARRQSFSALLTRGLIRVALDVPPNAEFEIVAVDDPYRCGTSLRSASMYRRPLPTTNLSFISGVMWDGRASVAGHAIRDDLVAQAADATVRHAAGPPPPLAQLRQIVDFELGLTSAQVRDAEAGSLTAAGARGGPGTMTREPFCLGINDPLGMRPAIPGVCLAPSRGLDPAVFTLFGGWLSSTPQRQAIARGEIIFNTRQFVIDDVPGLNANPSDPVPAPIRAGTCTVCHDTPNAGNHSVPMALNIGIAAASRRTPDLPLYTLRNNTTGATVQTTDPGRAMVKGRWNDIGKFKGPVLRALAARPPYFHDGSAATLADVVAFYDTRFRVRLTDREKADLIAFLRAL
jgi:cytochrome c peroxidase